MIIKRYIPLLLQLILFSACNTNTYYNPVPSLPVQFTYNILSEDPQFVPANTTSYRIFRKQRFETDYIGFAGLLLYIGMDMQYHAFDLACPKCLNTQQIVEIDGFYATCPICGEAYDVSYGLATPTRNISQFPLRNYRCLWDGTRLMVSN